MAAAAAHAAQTAPRPPEALALSSGPADSSGTVTPRAELSPKHSPDAAAVDGWRGWVVVAASSCSLFCYMGVIY